MLGPRGSPESPLSVFQITETNKAVMMIYYINTSYSILWYSGDFARRTRKRYRDAIEWGPLAGGPFEELEKAWENNYEVQPYSPFATSGNDQCRSKYLCDLTSTALATLSSTSPSPPLQAPFIPSAPGPQVLGVNTQCAPMQQVTVMWRLSKQKPYKEDTG